MIENITNEKIKWKYNKNIRTADHCYYVSNIHKAKQLLGWEPKIGLKEGLTDIIDWSEKNINTIRKLYE